MPAFILLFQCRDQKGIVARISEFILSCGGNILAADQYTTDPSGGDFFMRVEFSCEGYTGGAAALRGAFAPVAEHFQGEFGIWDIQERPRMGIFLSSSDHCLSELLYLWKAGELKAQIPFIAGNHPGHEALAGQYGIPFHHIPATRAQRNEGEFLALAKAQADFLVLARFMLVLSPEFLSAFGKDIINIHHGLLPAFKGPSPYRQAFAHGVKVIGATAHFVTERLDEGPIIVQLTEQVSHRDHVPDMVRKGRNLEKRALALAVEKYLERRVMRYGTRTVIF